MIKTPDEGRRPFNLAPTAGGDTLWGQNQDYPLGMLADRMEWDPAMQPAPAPAPVPPSDPDPDLEELRAFAATHKAIAAMKKAMEPTYVV
ncbi:hypothetical protein D3C85_1729420 [compost metagenome]